MTHIYRLTQSSEIMRVRRLGKSNAHPLLVLVAQASPQQSACRVAVVAGKSVGGAVQRNKAKRRIRAAIHDLADQVQPGFDIVAIARKPVVDVDYQTLKEVLMHLATLSRWTQKSDHV